MPPAFVTTVMSSQQGDSEYVCMDGQAGCHFGCRMLAVDCAAGDSEWRAADVENSA